MEFSAKFKVQDSEKILKKLKTLGVDMQKQAVKLSLGKSARLVAKAAKEKALKFDDKHTGRVIADNIVTRFSGKTSKRTGKIQYRIGVSSEKGRIPKGNPDTGKGGNTPHWHLLELGTEKMRAKPYLRPALNEKGEQATNLFVTDLDKQIDRLLKKAAQ